MYAQCVSDVLLAREGTCACVYACLCMRLNDSVRVYVLACLSECVWIQSSYCNENVDFM